MNPVQTIDGVLFAKMILAGCNNLKAHVKEVNDLNVFPIPDGDTGSNMLMTIMGGADFDGSPSENITEMSRRISDGMLLSARGNSGVILSQIFEGISYGFNGVDTADSDTIIKALSKGVEHSYRAVMEPTEGTMLTVMRLATGAIADKAGQNPESVFKEFLSAAKDVLDKTPDMLPVLKKAGVVDSGGAGLIYIFEGMLNALYGNEVEVSGSALEQEEQKLDLDLFTEDSVLEYGYCTELLLRLQKCKTDVDTFDVNSMTEYLKDIGDSVVAFKTGSIVKIHIHTMTPDRVLAFCQRYGEFLKIKIENMSLQHNNLSSDNANTSTSQYKKHTPYAVVAVASGDGIKQLFKERGADVVVDGGQCMNPSTENFLDAFKQANADTIFVLPNNSNIILTAKQAAGIYKDCDVRVIESRTIGDGYSALSMLSYDSKDTDIIATEMTEAMQGVLTASVSKSIRDTSNVNAGEYIGYIGKSILSANADRELAVTDMIDKLDMRKYDICLLIRGKDSSEEESKNIEKYITTHYYGKEVYHINGMQDIYDYIVILE